MSYVPRRTSTPIALCVIFRVAVIFDLHCLSAVPRHHRPRLKGCPYIGSVWPCFVGPSAVLLPNRRRDSGLKEMPPDLDVFRSPWTRRPSIPAPAIWLGTCQRRSFH